MKINDVKKRAFAMPLTAPAFPPGPYRFVDREYLIISYRTDTAALEAVLPEPLTFDDPIVNYEFIRMPNSTGFGDYTESGQVIPVRYNGKDGNYTHAMFLNDGPPIYGGREIWGFPKKYAQPALFDDKDTLVGTLDYGSVRSRPVQWGTSIMRWTRQPLRKRSPNRITCSKLFPISKWRLFRSRRGKVSLHKRIGNTTIDISRKWSCRSSVKAASL